MRTLLLLGGILSVIAISFPLLMLIGPRWLSARWWAPLRRLIIGSSLLYPGGLLVLMVVQVIWPQETGLWAVLQILAPYLFLPLLLLLPLALFRQTQWLRGILLLCLGAFVWRFGTLPRPAPPPIAPTVLSLSVMNWNLGLGTEAEQMARVRPALTTQPADIVVLAEAYWEWLEHDRAITQRYPYRVALYGNARKGLVLLSVYPVVSHDIPAQQAVDRSHPRQIMTQLDVQGIPITVIAVHTPAGIVRSRGCVVICYDVTERNRQLDQLHATVTSQLRQGTPLLVVGDFNLTPREPQYQRLATVLRDTHSLVGQGGGNTWPLARPIDAVPSSLDAILPLVRIDYQWSTGPLQPQASRTDCTRRGSDHCSRWGQYTLPAPALR